MVCLDCLAKFWIFQKILTVELQIFLYINFVHKHNIPIQIINRHFNFWLFRLYDNVSIVDINKGSIQSINHWRHKMHEFFGKWKKIWIRVSEPARCKLYQFVATVYGGASAGLRVWVVDITWEENYATLLVFVYEWVQLFFVYPV